MVLHEHSTQVIMYDMVQKGSKLTMTFGKQIRSLRLQKQMAQRDLAQLVGIDFTYLSKIENDKVPPPSEDVISKLAKTLNTSKEGLMVLAAKVDTDELREAVARDPRVGVLFRKLQSRELTDEQVGRMIAIAEENKKS